MESFAACQGRGRVTLNGQEVWRPPVYRVIDAILKREELIILGRSPSRCNEDEGRRRLIDWLCL